MEFNNYLGATTDLPTGSTNAGGEIAFSVEETNRIRAKLGLKPLNVETLKNNEEDKKKEREKMEAEMKTKEIQANIEK